MARTSSVMRTVWRVMARRKGVEASIAKPPKTDSHARPHVPCRHRTAGGGEAIGASFASSSALSTSRASLVSLSCFTSSLVALSCLALSTEELAVAGARSTAWTVLVVTRERQTMRRTASSYNSIDGSTTRLPSKPNKIGAEREDVSWPVWEPAAMMP